MGLGERLLSAGFGEPRGVVGRIGGALMARGNAATERHIVDLAAPTAEDTVLVIGPGPGVGLRAAAERAGQVVGVDPSAAMLAACRRRSAGLAVRLVQADAAHTGLPEGSVSVAVSVNNVMLWPDWAAGFGELHRVLRPGGRLWLSVHARWLPGGAEALAAAVTAAGFTDVATWQWEPPGRAASTATQLRACRPAR